jgi:Methyltransferase domain
VGERYPDASVIGVDLSPVQPKTVPPNVLFVTDDFEDDWLYPKDNFDYIHSRHIAMAVRDWDKMFSQALRYVQTYHFWQPDSMESMDTISSRSLFSNRD